MGIHTYCKLSHCYVKVVNSGNFAISKGSSVADEVGRNFFEEAATVQRLSGVHISIASSNLVLIKLTHNAV